MSDLKRGWSRAQKDAHDEHLREHIAHAVVYLRGRGMTYDELGHVFNYTRERIRQIYKVATENKSGPAA